MQLVVRRGLHLWGIKFIPNLREPYFYKNVINVVVAVFSKNVRTNLVLSKYGLNLQIVYQLYKIWPKMKVLCEFCQNACVVLTLEPWRYADIIKSTLLGSGTPRWIIPTKTNIICYDNIYTFSI